MKKQEGVLYVRGLNEKVIQDFKAYVRTKYGKVHTVLGLEVEAALKARIKEEEKKDEYEGAKG